jgi:GxxExxY protein
MKIGRQDEFTYLVIGKAMEAHRHLGPGLLFDFGKESLKQRRVAYTQARVTGNDLVSCQTQDCVEDRNLVRGLSERIVKIYHEYGPGYRDTTYRGLLFADFSADSVPCVSQPQVAVRMGGAVIGEATLDCLVVDDRSALLVVALRDHISPADRAILQTYLRQLHLPWGLVVNFGKRDLEVTHVKARLG